LPSCCASRSYRHPECSAQLAFACRSTLKRKSRFCAFCRLQYPLSFLSDRPSRHKCTKLPTEFLNFRITIHVIIASLFYSSSPYVYR
jgi:hypothetical protein